MKKLMIAAAAAAMIGSAQAITCVKGSETIKDPCTGEKTKVTYAGSATAHKVAISLKTTQPKSKTKKAKSACDAGVCTYWREQKTVKINGLLWELLSDTDCLEDCVPFGKNTAFWTDAAALDVEFAMGVGLIGKDGKKAEAYGTLSGADFGELAWAGFGSMSSGKENKCGGCTMYLKSITGGIAGQLIDPGWSDVCSACCGLIEYEGCCGDMQLANTAAYGTIKITYDAATAKKVVAAGQLGLEDEITAFYKLPAAAALDYAEGTVTPGEVIIEE